jgi:hypothetical protein
MNYSTIDDITNENWEIISKECARNGIKKFLTNDCNRREYMLFSHVLPAWYSLVVETSALRFLERRNA